MTRRPAQELACTPHSWAQVGHLGHPWGTRGSAGQLAYLDRCPTLPKISGSRDLSELIRGPGSASGSGISLSSLDLGAPWGTSGLPAFFGLISRPTDWGTPTTRWGTRALHPIFRENQPRPLGARERPKPGGPMRTLSERRQRRLERDAIRTTATWAGWTTHRRLGWSISSADGLGTHVLLTLPPSDDHLVEARAKQRLLALGLHALARCEAAESPRLRRAKGLLQIRKGTAVATLAGDPSRAKRLLAALVRGLAEDPAARPSRGNQGGNYPAIDTMDAEALA